jgi:hypothetical protein
MTRHLFMNYHSHLTSQSQLHLSQSNDLQLNTSSTSTQNLSHSQSLELEQREESVGTSQREKSEWRREGQSVLSTSNFQNSISQLRHTFETEFGPLFLPCSTPTSSFCSSLSPSPFISSTSTPTSISPSFHPSNRKQLPHSSNSPFPSQLTTSNIPLSQSSHSQSVSDFTQSSPIPPQLTRHQISSNIIPSTSQSSFSLSTTTPLRSLFTSFLSRISHQPNNENLSIQKYSFSKTFPAKISSKPSSLPHFKSTSKSQSHLQLHPQSHSYDLPPLNTHFPSQSKVTYPSHHSHLSHLSHPSLPSNFKSFLDLISNQTHPSTSHSLPPIPQPLSSCPPSYSTSHYTFNFNPHDTHGTHDTHDAFNSHYTHDTVHSHDIFYSQYETASQTISQSVMSSLLSSPPLQPDGIEADQISERIHNAIRKRKRVAGISFQQKKLKMKDKTDFIKLKSLPKKIEEITLKKIPNQIKKKPKKVKSKTQLNQKDVSFITLHHTSRYPKFAFKV